MRRKRCAPLTAAGTNQVPVAGGGFVRLYSETPVTLKLWTQRVRNANHIAKKLGPQVEVIHLDGEVELLFPQALAQEVLEMAGGAKRRIYTPVERAKLAERLAKAREKSPIGNRASNPLESSTANLEEVVNG